MQKYMKHKYMKYMVYVLYFIYFLYKKYMKTVLKSFLFLFILLIMIVGVRKILAYPIGEEWAVQTGMNEIHKYPNSYDVCFLGTSTIISNISNQQLYEEYGISGVSIGAPEQPLYLTKYTLKETLKYQSPQVVFLDTRSIFYPEATIRSRAIEAEDYVVHNSIDGIQTHSIKKEALNDVKKYNDKLDIWDYYSKLYYSHDNWKNLTESNFSNYDESDCMNGNSADLSITAGYSNVYNNNVNITTPITNHSEQVFSDIVKLCEDAGTELILITSYVQFYKSAHKMIAELARKYNIKYIDINNFMIKTNFQFETDLSDFTHFNLSGSIKWTNFLGEYLQKNYKFTDKRKDSSYQRYEKQREIFNQQKKCISDQKSLLSAISFYDYLNFLNKLDTNENIIFISLNSNVPCRLSDLESKLLHKLGLHTNYINKTDCGYAAVISKNSVQESQSFLNTAEIEGELNGMTYEIKSGGAESIEKSSIIINEEDMIQGGNGINFVIYNTRFEKAVNSCFFDITSYINPPQSKITTTAARRIQYETDPNVWEFYE